MRIKKTDGIDVDELPRELIELGRRVAELPPEHLEAIEKPFRQVVEGVRRRRRILSLVQEALAQLRLDVKYLVFDLDVTRKERDELRAEVEGASDDYDSH